MKLSYEDYKRYHASKCKICKGAERVQKGGIWVACGCQHVASVKWDYDQIKIYPENIKYKTWDDFIGIDDKGAKLTDQSFVDAKEKALRYCFDRADPSVTKDRAKHSIILRHCQDAQNVVIVGGPHSGKTLVATLILKEVIFAAAMKQTGITFRWVRSPEIIDAARWDGSISGTSKTIDRDLLEDLAEVHFLFIDGLDLRPERGDHRFPPDMLSLNTLFSRRLEKSPTILICSDQFWKAASTPGHSDLIREQWGDDFSALLGDPRNLVIELRKEAKRVGR